MTQGLVLRAGPHREYDRLCVLYSEQFGKIRVRYIGVERPGGKLKALAETMVLGEYRMYLRDGADFATGAGGAIDTSFPGIRGHLPATMRGFEMLELLDVLTPFWKPHAEMLYATEEFLRALDAAPRGGAWLVPALALRLMASAGYGFAERRVSVERAGLWRLLHDAPAAEVAALADDPAARGKLEGFLRGAVERVGERPLRAAAMRDALLHEAATA